MQVIHSFPTDYEEFYENSFNLLDFSHSGEEFIYFDGNQIVIKSVSNWQTIDSIPEPSLKSNSTEEMISVLNGSYFEKFDPFASYGMVKCIGTLWMSSLARKHPNIRFVSVSPGATQGTNITSSMDNAMMKFMFKYIMMPIVMPMRGMAHKVEKGAKRCVNAVNSANFKSGGFYASEESKVIGKMVDQSSFYAPLANEAYQDNATAALSHFV